MSKKKRSLVEEVFDKCLKSSEKFIYEPVESIVYYKTSYLPDWRFDSALGSVVVEVKEWLPPHEMKRIKDVASHYAKLGVLFVVAVYFRDKKAPIDPQALLPTWPTQGRMERERLCSWLDHHNIKFICFDRTTVVEPLLSELASKYYA